VGRLQNKVAIVTGAASGIGRAIAEGFLKEGAQVCIADINQKKCEQVASELGQGAIAVAVNVTDLTSIDLLVTSVEEQLGGIDILVNCAGVFGMEAVTEVTEAEFDRILGVNIRGLVFVTKAVLRSMLASGRRGAVVNIASVAGRHAAPGAAAYCISKAAVISYTQAAAQEMAPAGIRVNALAPGATDTAMWQDDVIPRVHQASGLDATASHADITPAGRIGTAGDCVGAAVFLASEDSEFVIGQTLNVDGGYQMN
jgi:NAD(P)-dependent dehydrogenase (short-subunit alcohol dehydrogenase family)